MGLPDKLFNWTIVQPPNGLFQAGTLQHSTGPVKLHDYFIGSVLWDLSHHCLRRSRHFKVFPLCCLFCHCPSSPLIKSDGRFKSVFFILLRGHYWNSTEPTPLLLKHENIGNSMKLIRFSNLHWFSWRLRLICASSLYPQFTPWPRVLDLSSNNKLKPIPTSFPFLRHPWNK